MNNPSMDYTKIFMIEFTIWEAYLQHMNFGEGTPHLSYNNLPLPPNYDYCHGQFIIQIAFSLFPSFPNFLVNYCLTVQGQNLLWESM